MVSNLNLQHRGRSTRLNSPRPRCCLRRDFAAILALWRSSRNRAEADSLLPKSAVFCGLHTPHIRELICGHVVAVSSDMWARGRCLDGGHTVKTKRFSHTVYLFFMCTCFFPNKSGVALPSFEQEWPLTRRRGARLASAKIGAGRPGGVAGARRACEPQNQARRARGRGGRGGVPRGLRACVVNVGHTCTRGIRRQSGGGHRRVLSQWRHL